MNKNCKDIPIGALIKLHKDNSIGVITGIMSGTGKYAVYTINWLVDYNDNQNWQQAFFFEVIG